MNITDPKSREAEGPHKVPTMSFGESPRDSVDGKDAELVTRDAWLAAGV